MTTQHASRDSKEEDRLNSLSSVYLEDSKSVVDYLFCNLVL